MTTADSVNVAGHPAQDHSKVKPATAAVLLDMSVPALVLGRCFSQQGLRVICLDTKVDHWTHRTRFAEIIEDQKFRDDEYLTHYLIGLSKELGNRPLLIPLHDDYVRFVSQQSVTLATHFRLSIADRETIATILDKQKTSDKCEAIGIPGPKTISVSSKDDVQNAVSRIQFPVIYKPVFSRSWQTESAQAIVLGRKVVPADTANELLQTYDELSPVDPHLVIQELIPGPEEDLYYVLTFVDRNGSKPGYFVGRKWRTSPAMYGRGCYVESVVDRGFLKFADMFIEATGYVGSIGIEFKLDPRDNEFKIIEINARYGLWDGFAEDCGFPSAESILRDAAGLDVLITSGYRTGLRWINPELDFIRSAQELRQDPRTLFKTLKRYLLPHRSAVFSWRDPIPGWACWIGIFGLLAKALFRRIFRRANR